MNRTVIAALVAMAMAAACAEQHAAALGFANVENAMASGAQDYDEGEELPFAEGRAFETLDEYLEFLRERGAYDVPWFQEIRPGVYALISRRGPNAPPIVFTREQLMERFGFTR